MTRVADLEAQVRAAWNRGTQVAFGADPEFSPDDLVAMLNVYADELQQLGDPRGELIAHDLRGAKDDRVRTEWLGAYATHPNVNTKYGLLGVSITDTEPNLLADLLTTRCAPYLSSVSIFGDVYTVRSTLVALSKEVRPWLGALRIVVPMAPIGTTFRTPAIAPELVAQVIQASPALYSLWLEGLALVRDFAHPTLRRLVTNTESNGALNGIGEPFPSVTHADIDMFALGIKGLPALRALDLSRNEQLVYRAFRSLDVLRQLTHVRLPVLVTQEDRDLLQAALDDMPHLERLEIVEVRARGIHLRHPTATIVLPPAKPWQFDEPALVLSIGDGEHIVDLRELVATMERVYERLPVDARVLWDDWWEAVPDRTPFPASSLADALDACGALPDAWRQVAIAAREAGDAMVQIALL